MELIADILLGAGALGAAAYCMVLSRRLKRLTQLEGGMGGAIAVLSAQVDDLTRTLGRAETAAKTSAERLDAQTRRAEDAVRRLELLLSSLHDLPAPSRPAAAATPAPDCPAADRPAPEAPPPETAAPPPPRARVLRRRARRAAEAEAEA